ncbi:uncharacterized protein [Amphiura filiformis]|uniref:uncharacterized protein n=1 Tax=Amphiura filiformis TaxID=82378 RepID=UPI003B21DA90
MAISESWLYGDDRDKRTIADVKSMLPDHDLYHQPRKSRNGGGGLLTFYRPQYRARNKPTTSMFFTEFGTLLESVTLITNTVVLVGDFNIHVDDEEDTEARNFLEILEAAGLHQLIDFPTHVAGHTLDLIITHCGNDVVSDLRPEHALFSDHFAFKCRLNVKRPAATKKTLCFRKFKNLKVDEFSEDIVSSSLITAPADDVDGLVNQYNATLAKLIDHHVPERTKTISLRPHAPWYTDAVRDAKRSKRSLERRMVKSGLQVDRQAYKEQCKQYHAMLEDSKTQHHRAEIANCNSKQLFSTINKICGLKSATVLPSGEEQVVADRFGEYFTGKISAIRANLDNSDTQPSVTKDNNRACPVSLCQFQEISEQEVACVTPIIKKASLNPEVLSNYRPVSNLSFISKLNERAVCSQLHEHLTSNNLYAPHQSAYRPNCSTETALLRLQNDLLCALDSRKDAVLVLLDLSAAFDTVDHGILLSRMQSRHGITGTALQWFESYNTDRVQSIAVGSQVSQSHKLIYGVPQGSVVGPSKFTMYSAPLEDVISGHGINVISYADDTQLYCSFYPDERDAAISRLESCIADVKRWLLVNKLQLNDSKTEVVHIASPFTLTDPISAISIGQSDILPSNQVRNLGVTFDHHLSLKAHVNKLCQAASLAIRSIGQIRKYLDQESTEKLVHAYVTSRLDYCNCLLYGLPDKLISKLQRLQNSAARLVTGAKKRDHISQVIRDLHWLPIKKRIIFKLLLIIYKALNNAAPNYITELLKPYHPISSLRSASRELLVVPKSRTKSFGDRAFSIAGPNLWNSLPMDIRKARSVEQFKSLLKTYLFNLDI